MKINTITDAFEFLRMDGSASECLVDCMNAYALGKGELEKHFDSHLWLDAKEGDFESYAAQQYYISLARIEEFLVKWDLIYND